VNQTEREKVELCASCGKQAASKVVPELDNAVLCDDCANRLADRRRPGETFGYWESEEEPELSPEKRFAELEERFAPLFKAAQVLLREGIDEEDLIYPTLAHANELGQQISDRAYANELGLQQIPDLAEEAGLLVSAKPGVDWEAAVERFVERHAGIIPERITEDGVVILRWLPVVGHVRLYPITERKVPEKVTLRIRAHARLLEPEEITSVYERTLSAHEVNYGKGRTGSIDFATAEHTLEISTYASTDTATRIPSKHAAAVFSNRNPEFIYPKLMAKFCQALLEPGKLPDGTRTGYEHLLAYRKRGPGPTSTPKGTAKLIRSCVAFFLEHYGGLEKGVAAHRLLNEHVQPLPDDVKELPDEGISDYQSTPLWRDAKKAGVRLEAAARDICAPEFTV
jgi:hypothetical protein